MKTVTFIEISKNRFYFQNNVSWGTREVAQKQSKKELEEQRKKEEEAAKDAKKHQKKDGILGFLMAQADRKNEKGGIEFSLANLVNFKPTLEQDYLVLSEIVHFFICKPG